MSRIDELTAGLSGEEIHRIKRKAREEAAVDAFNVEARPLRELLQPLDGVVKSLAVASARKHLRAHGVISMRAVLADLLGMRDPDALDEILAVLAREERR